MSFYDHLSFYLDNGAYNPGTGDAHRKRNVRYAAKTYFTKGVTLLPFWWELSFRARLGYSMARYEFRLLVPIKFHTAVMFYYIYVYGLRGTVVSNH